MATLATWRPRTTEPTLRASLEGRHLVPVDPSKPFQVVKLSVQPDKLRHLGGNNYELIAFKRVVVECKSLPHSMTQGESGPFKLVLNARGNTLVVTSGESMWDAGTIAEGLQHALQRLSATGESPLRLPPHHLSDENMEVIACGVTDAMLVAGMLHSLRDLGGWAAPSPGFPHGLAGNARPGSGSMKAGTALLATRTMS